MPKVSSIVQHGAGWVVSSPTDADVEVKAKVVEAPTKEAPKKTAGARPK
jgi:hypothetical protein